MEGPSAPVQADPSFTIAAARQGHDGERIKLGRIDDRLTDTDRLQIAGELADEFERSLPDRLAALTVRADAHRVKIADTDELGNGRGRQPKRSLSTREMKND